MSARDPLDDSEDDNDRGELEERRDFKACADCNRETAGETCGACGNDLCPMCFECGGGFCGKEHTQEQWDDVARAWGCEPTQRPSDIKQFRKQVGL